MDSCENCLFYVDAMPHEVICIGHKRIKSYPKIQKNCKRWIENTPENAKEWLKKNEGYEK